MNSIDFSQRNITGAVELKLYKGNVIVVGRESPVALYSKILNILFYSITKIFFYQRYSKCFIIYYFLVWHSIIYNSCNYYCYCSIISLIIIAIIIITKLQQQHKKRQKNNNNKQRQKNNNNNNNNNKNKK